MNVYLLAGIATAPNFLEDLREELLLRYQKEGIDARALVAFPYGDWHRSRLRQLQEMGRDLSLGIRRFHHSIGGQRVADTIRSTSKEGPIIIIGHSGGGVAAIHAAAILKEKGSDASVRVVQIGSPKCPIPLEFNSSVLYLRAVGNHARPKDPITRLGRWGGWERGPGGLFHWNPRHAAPAAYAEVSIVGGHRDYFRKHPPYLQQGVSNLQITTDLLWDWLRRSDYD